MCVEWFRYFGGVIKDHVLEVILLLIMFAGNLLWSFRRILETVNVYNCQVLEIAFCCIVLLMISVLRRGIKEHVVSFICDFITVS